MKKRLPEEQIIGILEKQEAGERTAEFAVSMASHSARR